MSEASFDQNYGCYKEKPLGRKFSGFCEQVTAFSVQQGKFIAQSIHEITDLSRLNLERGRESFCSWFKYSRSVRY